MRAAPWKSGASAPRKAPQPRGLQPRWSDSASATGLLGALLVRGARARRRNPIIVDVLRSKVTEQQDASTSHLVHNLHPRILRSHQQVFLGGNAVSLVANNRLVAVERQTIFRFAANPENSQWE